MNQKNAGKLVEEGQSGMVTDVDVLILGAGAAGLCAASTFLKRGFDRFLVLEGAGHVGGRVHDVEFGGVRVEKGANWLQPIEGPMAKIAEKVGLECQQGDYSQRGVVVRSEDGEVIPQWEMEEQASELCDILVEAGEFAASTPQSNLTMRDFMAERDWFSSSDALRKTIEWYIFEFEYTVPPEEASVDVGHWDRLGNSGFVTDQRGFKTIFSDVVANLVQKNLLLLNSRVVSIDQSQIEKVCVVCADGSVFRADAVLLTFSLGVLQNGLVAFTPPLPPWKTAALNHTPMGAFTKIFLKFPRKFWDDQEMILHVSQRKGYYPFFINMEAKGLLPSGNNILVGFLVGAEAQRVESQPLDTTREEVVAVLRGMYGAQVVPDPTEIQLSGWLNDPLQMGAYSAPVRDGIPSKTLQRLQTRVGRVYFAGEATDEKYSGFVVGGMRSGKREAKKIMRQVLKWEVKQNNFPTY
ncbi:polyamine oxidase-like [Acanthaster planci]|uniref:Amine oxidase n=1 Tax=Acanthaster planci TaxID=133434 RepID=A0A8B7ZPQ7_ACAPL|nr:polyamine oxidase-like [Acanthaster planci]XP_022107027.1 polyamine oxidase-like [Acanthaster planci]